MAKYVFVTGGVVSGLGKGISASSIALNTTYYGSITKTNEKGLVFS